MLYIDLIGFVAGVGTTVAYVPQVIKTYTTKSAKDLSLSWLVILTTGVALWAAYGILLLSWPLILANGIGFFLDASLIAMKVRYDRAA